MPRAVGSSPASIATSEQLRVVGQHPLVVRHGPVAPRGVAEEAAFDRVAERRAGHRGERAIGDRGRPRGSRSRTAPRLQKPQCGRDRELRRGRVAAAEAAELPVLASVDRGGGAGDVVDRRQVSLDGCRRLRLGERRSDRIRRAVDLLATLRPRLGDGAEHLRERRQAGSGLGREVRPGVERPALGRGEDRQRPAEVPGESGRGGHVGGIHLGMLLAVDLDRDEVRFISAAVSAPRTTPAPSRGTSGTSSSRSRRAPARRADVLRRRRRHPTGTRRPDCPRGRAGTDSRMLRVADSRLHVTSGVPASPGRGARPTRLRRTPRRAGRRPATRAAATV